VYSGLVEKVFKESSIDFPQVDLDSLVWEKEDGYYFLREEVKDKILILLDKYPEIDLLQIAREIRIVGSIGTNLYVDDADVDLHVVPNDFSEWDEKKVKRVMDWYKKNESLDKYIGKHPIEVYVQLNPNQDLMSAAVYDVLEDRWVVGPKIVSLDYDPYKEFQHVADDVRQAVQDADLLLGELKRDVIDYDTIRKAIENLPTKHKKRLLQKLRNKLEEIEKDIENLYTKRKEWVDARHGASKPETPEQAREDVELAIKFRDTNALFKFINRYGYMRIIADLEDLIKDDGEITPNEVDIIRGVVGNV
jgi:hypothetical protein